MEDPSMDYQAVAHRLEERLQVELSDAQKQGIRGVMARISIQLVADAMAMPEQSELEVFSGDVREHVEYIRDLVVSNPELGYKSIGRKLQERLGERLSTAHLQVVHRIMNRLSEDRAAGVELEWEDSPSYHRSLPGCPSHPKPSIPETTDHFADPYRMWVPRYRSRARSWF